MLEFGCCCSSISPGSGTVLFVRRTRQGFYSGNVKVLGCIAVPAYSKLMDNARWVSSGDQKTSLPGSPQHWDKWQCVCFSLVFWQFRSLGTVRFLRLVLPQEEGGQILCGRNPGMDGPVFANPGGGGHGCSSQSQSDSRSSLRQAASGTRIKVSQLCPEGLHLDCILGLEVKVTAPHHLLGST